MEVAHENINKTTHSKTMSVYLFEYHSGVITGIDTVGYSGYIWIWN